MADPTDQVEYINVDLDVQDILLAASQHNIPRLRHLIRSNESPENPVNVRDPETGCTPLHAAIGSCEPDAGEANGEPVKSDGEVGLEAETAGAEENVLETGRETVKFLLGEGAIWNDLDANDETPGCLARRLKLPELYEVMVDAGVRAEILLNRLDEYDQLEDDDSELGENEKPDIQGSAEPGPTQTTEEHSGEHAAESTVEQNVDSSRYLQSDLTFHDSRLLDEDRNGVMMAWESDIMAKSARSLLSNPGLRVLNIGHGMGIVDGIFQGLQPSSHHIIEAHPAVLADMKNKGWDEKPGVVVHPGKWQDVLPKLIDEGVTFDAIYYDTFAESYSDFRHFFTEHVIGLLEPEGKWGFFNGMGADRQLSYDVYQKVVEMDLLEAGFDVDWEEIRVPSLEDKWSGVRRKYWVVDNYRLPVCKYMD